MPFTAPFRSGLKLSQVLLSRLLEANTAGSGSPNILTDDEAFTHFTNEGSTAENYHTLPSAAGGGGPFTFTCQDSDGIRITAASGDTIFHCGTTSATAGYIRSNVIGSTVTLEAINATEWIATHWTGHWITDNTGSTTNYGYATLGSAYNFPGATANFVAVEPGLSFTLPCAGTWLLKYTLNALINFSAGSNGRLFGYLYNVTGSAQIANTLNELVFWPTTGASATDMRYTEVVFTATVPTEICVKVYSAGGTTWTARAIDYPGTFLGFERVP